MIIQIREAGLGSLAPLQYFRYKSSKTYDFKDLVDAIEISDFFLWKDNKSQIKTNKKANRVLLKDVVVFRAERGKFNIYYKTDITNNVYQELDFLNKSHLKKTPLPPSKTTPCGIHENKMEELIDRLKLT
ncbi:Uncharacterized protein FWK35_00022897 [Aphis craccivora]|uniref:Uncharacterized protein n=1 Tax=Aphis craccivora TaxID=307492 RepID=A0A6G0VX93_APHCR|nr:Uncharacterized protein FWK35_00022897 [Aphis craccivora]